MDYKDFDIKRTDLESGEFIGMASPYGVLDHGNDIVDEGAFNRTIKHKKGVVPLLWQHNHDEPIGIAELEDTKKGLTIKGKLNMEVQKAKEAIALLKQKAVKGLSIGYEVVKQEFDDTIRHLKEIKLWEISVVTFPMNPKAQVNQVKSVMPYKSLPLFNAVAGWSPKNALKRITSFADEGKMELKDAFLYNNGEMKLQIGDVIDEKLYAVPNAIYFAGNTLHESSEDFTPEEMTELKKHLEIYYKRLDATPPWKQTQDGKLLQEIKTLLVALRQEVSEKADSDKVHSCLEEPKDGLAKDEKAEMDVINNSIKTLIKDLKCPN